MAKILIIDDEAPIRTVINHILTREGHDVDEAENGEVGLRLIELHPYDLVITDIVMPAIDGIGVILSLKEKYPHIRIIAITGGAAKNDRVYFLNVCKMMKVDLVLPKPFKAGELKSAVNKVLNIQ